MLHNDVHVLQHTNVLLILYPYSSRGASAAIANRPPTRAPPIIACELRLQLVRCVRKLDQTANICGMSYNSQGDELFFVDYGSGGNKMVRSMSVRDNTGDLRVVYRGSAHDASPAIFSVCHMRDSATLLVCSCEKGRTTDTPAGWWH